MPGSPSHGDKQFCAYLSPVFPSQRAPSVPHPPHAGKGGCLQELNSYLTTEPKSSMVVDRSGVGELLRINFNVSFHALSCEFATLDVSDALGTVGPILPRWCMSTELSTSSQMVHQCDRSSRHQGMCGYMHPLRYMRHLFFASSGSARAGRKGPREGTLRTSSPTHSNDDALAQSSALHDGQCTRGTQGAGMQMCTDERTLGRQGLSLSSVVCLVGSASAAALQEQDARGPGGVPAYRCL